LAGDGAGELLGRSAPLLHLLAQSLRVDPHGGLPGSLRLERSASSVGSSRPGPAAPASAVYNGRPSRPRHHSGLLALGDALLLVRVPAERAGQAELAELVPD